MLQPYILISINTRIETSDWKFGKKFLSVLTEQDGFLTPDQISNTEKFKDKFDNIDACAAKWAPAATIRSQNGVHDFRLDFHWKRKLQPQSRGWIMHTFRNDSGRLRLGKITLKCQPVLNVDWENLFLDLCASCTPEFGMIHFFSTPEQLLDGRSGGREGFGLGVSDLALQKGLPDLAWGTFWSRDVKLKFGAGVLVANCHNGHFVRITNNIFDLQNNYEYFADCRAKAKSILPPGTFVE